MGTVRVTRVRFCCAAGGIMNIIRARSESGADLYELKAARRQE